jgi:hypothetical protein
MRNQRMVAQSKRDRNGEDAIAIAWDARRHVGCAEIGSGLFLGRLLNVHKAHRSLRRSL